MIHRQRPKLAQRPPGGAAKADLLRRVRHASRLKDRPALKGHPSAADISGNLDLGCGFGGRRVGGLLVSQVAARERHDDTVCPLADHARQLQADPLLGRDGDLLTVDEAAETLNFQITELELHRSPWSGTGASGVQFLACESNAPPSLKFREEQSGSNLRSNAR